MFISLIWCYRLVKLKLKEKDDLFLTNSNGLLKLMPPDINNQTIRIHERKLTFVNFNKTYKFYLNNGSLEIKLRRVEEERHKIGFLRSGFRRKVKPFGFHSKRKMVPKDFVRSKNSEHDPPKKETGGVPREMVSSREITAREMVTSKEPVPKDPTPPVKELNKSNTKKEEFYSQDDPPDHDETEVDDDAKQIEILKSLISNLEGESEVKTSKPKVVQEKKEDNFMVKLKQIFKKKRLNEEVYIESDSKLEEDTVSEQFIDVIVSSINKTYFKLKTATGNCVTFMDNIFLFAPCINIDNQVFMTVNEEEVRRKMKESIALISYEKNMRNKYKTNCDDYYKLCNRGSPSYDETTCKQLREECEDESSDEGSSRIIPERKPLPVYPFRRQETSKTDNFSIPSESVVRSSFFKTSPSLNSITLNNDPPPVVNQTATVKTVTAIKSPPVSTITQSTLQTTSSLRDIIKAEAGKKDFSPDDIIEKLKKSIKSNDISDILS